MSELPVPQDVAEHTEVMPEPSYPVKLPTETAFYFLRALNDERSIEAMRAVYPERVGELENSAAHALFLKLKAAPGSAFNNEQVVQISLTQAEYGVLNTFGQPGQGFNGNDDRAVAKRNLRALGRAFQQSKKDAGAPGPIRSVVNKIIPTRFRK